MTALLSIKPEFAEAIFDGRKKFEFRKVIFRKNVKKIKVYVTKPIGKIIGEFAVDDILRATPEDLWDKTKAYAGIDKKSYLDYFHGKDIGFAIKIKSVKKYSTPICPFTSYPKFVAPQSFKYVS